MADTTKTEPGTSLLTEEQILAEARFHFDADAVGWAPVLAFARALLATPAPLSDEPVAFDKALKETYGMVDAFNPPPAGTYYRGQHDGIIAALKTIADNFKRHAAPTPSDKQEAVSIEALADELSTSYGHHLEDDDTEAGHWWTFDRAALAAFADRLATPLAQSAEQDTIKALKADIAENDALIDELREKLKSAEQDRIDAERWRSFKRFAHHSYNQKVTSHAHSASLMKEHFITVHAGSWDELESHIDAAIGANK